MAMMDVTVPDIGDFDEVAVIEMLVKVGDSVKAEQSLITVESDKASMEIPSSHAGVVKTLQVKLGDKVKQGSAVLTLEAASGAGAADTAGAAPAAPAAQAVLPAPDLASKQPVAPVPPALTAITSVASSFARIYEVFPRCARRAVGRCASSPLSRTVPISGTSWSTSVFPASPRTLSQLAGRR